MSEFGRHEVKWRGDAFFDDLSGTVHRRLRRAAIHVQKEVKRRISRPGPIKTRPHQEASKPGEPPKRRTGTLQRSIAFQVDGDVARIGTNKVYGAVLESPAGLNRPYLVTTLDHERDMIAAILMGAL